jgi:hypothetical protein
MHWTYEEYLSQPPHFILMLFELLRAQAEHSKTAVE